MRVRVRSRSRVSVRGGRVNKSSPAFSSVPLIGVDFDFDFDFDSDSDSDSDSCNSDVETIL